MTRILIADAVHEYDSLLESREGQHVLRGIHGTASARCACRPGVDLPLAVVARGGHFHLRRYPLTGREHDADCVFYGDIDPSALTAAPSPLVDVDGHTLKITLATPLHDVGSPRGAAGGSVHRGSSGATAGMRMTLLGLLQLLWETADLHIWWPKMHGKRNAPLVAKRLLDATGAIRVSDEPLHDVLLLPTWDSTADRDALRERAIAQAEIIAGRSKRGRGLAIVIGELGRTVQSRFGPGLTLRAPFPPLWDADNVCARLKESFPAVWMRHERRQAGEEADPRRAGHRTFVVATVALERRSALALRDAALLETTSRFIPIASDYESQLEARLVAEARAFAKPLVYDPARGLHPDFELLDAGRPHPALEVFGFDGDPYAQRRAEKIATYRRQSIPCWYWDVAAGEHGLNAPLPHSQRFRSAKPAAASAVPLAAPERPY